MKIMDVLKGGHQCQACGDYFPVSVLITLSGYGNWSGVYCTYCAQHIIDQEEE